MSNEKNDQENLDTSLCPTEIVVQNSDSEVDIEDVQPGQISRRERVRLLEELRAIYALNHQAMRTMVDTTNRIYGVEARLYRSTFGADGVDRGVKRKRD